MAVWVVHRRMRGGVRRRVVVVCRCPPLCVLVLLALMIGLPVVMRCSVCLVVAVMVRRGWVAEMRGWRWVPPPGLRVVTAVATPTSAATSTAIMPWMRSGVLMG